MLDIFDLMTCNSKNNEFSIIVFLTCNGGMEIYRSLQIAEKTKQ